jgi:hypothetical protein
MLSKAAKRVDWIEAHCMVPEGASVGAHVVLRPFQVEGIYAIYNNNRGSGQTVMPDVPIEIPDAEGGTLSLTENRVLDACLSKKDRAAMALALRRCYEQSPERARQIERMAESRPWARVGAFAAYCEQYRTLNLDPGDVAPCHVNDPDTPLKEEQDAARLLRRMRRLGISKWDPDPMAAITEAKARKRTRNAQQPRIEGSRLRVR